MSFEPLLESGWLILSHAVAALAAFVLGTVQLAAPKGTWPDKSLGYVWCGMMLWVAGSSLFIYEIRLLGPFSPIHLLSLLALFGVIGAVLEARRKDIAGHKRTMIILYSGALIVAGFFAFLPGRTMHSVLFGT
ncbi:MAG: DUF2306 domain-containing protein [Roseibium sp.]|nr:DUF2306 domain-containing protein [Roseibium sp.]